MLVTVLGIFIDVNCVASMNALFPILVTDDGSSIDVIAVLEKAESPILVSCELCGNVTAFNPCANGAVFNPCENVTVVKLCAR